MNREIKFRAWDKVLKVILHPDDDIAYEYQITANGQFKRDGMNTDVELMQYTGLRDKNGKEIYEGDIDKESLGYVGFCDKCVGYQFFYDLKNKKEICHRCDGNFEINEEPIEIIGNIYENSELLK